MISNSNRYGDARWLRRKLGNEDLIQYFEVVIGTGGFLGHLNQNGSKGCHKPSSAVFERALAFLNVPAERAVYIGDSFDNDILAAAEVGMTPLHVHVDRENYTAKLWELLEDSFVKRHNVLTTYALHFGTIRCKLRHFTDPLYVDERIVVGLDEYEVDGFDVPHTKEDILNNSFSDKIIVTLDVQPVKRRM